MTQDTSKTPLGADKVSRYGWVDPGIPGRFVMLHKDQIVIPADSYQRSAAGGEADRKVLKIASEFSWIAFQVVSIAERDGVHYAVDGGHRVRAARRRSDISMVPCMVFESESIKDEAKAFDVVNSNRKAMGAVDRHRAHLVQNDEVAIKAELYAAKASRVISKNGSSGTISCVNDLKRCIKEDECALSTIWELVVSLCEGQKMVHSVLMGIYYIERYATEPASSDRISRKIRSIGYEGIAKSAQSGAAYHGHRSPKAFADGMLKVINKGFQNKIEIPQ